MPSRGKDRARPRFARVVQAIYFDCLACQGLVMFVLGWSQRGYWSGLICDEVTLRRAPPPLRQAP